MILHGDCLETLKQLPNCSVQCCVTSPPYFGLRDYCVDGQIGLEETPEQYVQKLVDVFREVRRLLKDDGTLWLNLGDSYARAGGWSDNAGLSGMKRGESGRAKTNMTGGGGCSQKLAAGYKQKDILGIPWRVAFALQADGWYLRQDIIWHKPNPMPESVKDRCTKAHEYVFLLSKAARYYFDADAVKEDAVKGAAGSTFNKGKTAEHQLGRSSDKDRAEDGKRNRRSVWTVATKPLREAHFATFPEALIEPCILAGTKRGDTVLDPFFGSGTTGAVSVRLGREYIGCELNAEYIEIARRRLSNTQRGLPLL